MEGINCNRLIGKCRYNVGALAVNVTILKILLIQLCHRKIICDLMVIKTSVSGTGVSGSVC